jgi:hypothetical protein
VPPPTRKVACRLTVTYAGFEGESSPLQTLYKKGLSQPLVGSDLYAGGGLLMFWTHKPVAPWQTPEWIEQMRSQALQHPMTNALYYGDNLVVLREHVATESVDLILS